MPPGIPVRPRFYGRLLRAERPLGAFVFWRWGMENQDKIILAKECIKDWQAEKLSSFSAMVAMAIIIDPQPVSEAGMRWAEKVLLEYRQSNK